MDKIAVLLVEDDPADVDMMREALSEINREVELIVAENGQEALEYLDEEAQGEQRIDIIFLDLNLPKLNGYEVLKRIKSDERLKSIPTIILTTSNYYEDVIKTYSLGCNSFVTKPFGLENFSKFAHAIDEFWFKMAKLPRRSHANYAS